MRVQNEAIKLTCTVDELDEVTGLPPVVDDSGVAIRDDSVCEVLDEDLNKVVSVWRAAGGAWYLLAEL